MEYRGFKNKLSAIITAVSLVVVVVGTSVGSFRADTRGLEKGDVVFAQEASESLEIELVEATITNEAE